MSSQLIIKSYTPFNYWLKVVVVVAALSIIVWLTYLYGYYRAGFDNSDLFHTRQILAQKIDHLEQFNGNLREKNAALSQSSRVDHAAYANVDVNLQELQDEILELKQEVAFYRGIVAPKEAAAGLNITRMHMKHIGETGGYRFKLVLTQLKNNTRLIVGRGKIVISGLLNGHQKQLNLAEVTDNALRELKLRFKYFQNIEADIVLPDGFVPSSVAIDLIPRGKGYSRIKKSYDWADIIS